MNWLAEFFDVNSLKNKIKQNLKWTKFDKIFFSRPVFN